MKNKKIVIIGAVAGGATTAARARRLDESAQIVMFERGRYVSYANCGLPYYIGGTISQREKLFLQSPESFHALLNVDVRIGHEVTGINRNRKTVTVKNLDTGESSEESFDKLVLSPGAEPITPPIPGIGSDKIFTLRNVPDTDGIKAFMDKTRPQRAVVIGAGFIGLEMAENLHKSGISVTIVEALDQVMSILDYEMAAEVHQHLKEKSVELYLNDAVSSFQDAGKTISVTLKSGRIIKADMVVLSIGVKPETRLALEAGLKIGSTGGIQVDSCLRTSDLDIYALGDAIEYPNPITGDPLRIPLAGPANKQGRMVADNIFGGNKKHYRGTIATGIAKVFDLTVASTGLSEKQLLTMGIPSFETLIIHAPNHAGYYPGGAMMSMKIIFNKERKLMGAQIVGREGVDKRIDLLSAILGKAGTIDDLQEIEQAYAPPFSSAKDPVNIAGFMAENILDGLSAFISWKEFRKLPAGDYTLIDVRTTGEFQNNTIAGAINIPLDTIRSRISEIPKDRKIILFCAVGKRAYSAERILRQRGFDNLLNLSGGIKTYNLAMQKQSNEDIFPEGTGV